MRFWRLLLGLRKFLGSPFGGAGFLTLFLLFLLGLVGGMISDIRRMSFDLILADYRILINTRY